jgi:hypothetical protein
MSRNTTVTLINHHHKLLKVICRSNLFIYSYIYLASFILCGLVVRVPEVPGSIPGATRFSDK